MLSRQQTWRRAGATIVLAIASVALAGCTAVSGADAGARQPKLAQTPGSATRTVTPDACALLSNATVSTLLQTPVTGRRTTAELGASACTWQNSATFESVSLSVGPPGSAADLAVSSPSTPPDDVIRRYLGDGALQFGASGRLITIEVADARVHGSDADAMARSLAASATAALQT